MTIISPDDADLGDLAECERTLLRDVARIRNTRPPALAAAEEFIIGWLDARLEQDWNSYFEPPPEEFFDAYERWQNSLPPEQRRENEPAHELDDPIDVLFWDLDMWPSLVCVPEGRLPPPHLDEAVLIDIFGCEREIPGRVRAIWRRRYPEADAAQWDKWFGASVNFSTLRLGRRNEAPQGAVAGVVPPAAPYLAVRPARASAPPGERQEVIETLAEAWLPNDVGSIVDHQTALPRLAKNARLIAQIEHTACHTFQPSTTCSTPMRAISSSSRLRACIWC